jgi:hypothetical protein
VAATRWQSLPGCLGDLKRRSGLSFQQIGLRAHLGKSTVHRICAGRTVPADFGTIERIGKACRASRVELIELHRLWVYACELGRLEAGRAGSSDDGFGHEPGGPAGLGVAGAPLGVRGAPAGWSFPVGGHWVAALAVVVVLSGWAAVRAGQGSAPGSAGAGGAARGAARGVRTGLVPASGAGAGHHVRAHRAQRDR